MTGFGSSKLLTGQSQIEVSVRSVNGRFLENRYHLPREFVGFESEIKKVLEKYFERGTVDVFVSRKARPGKFSHKLYVNRPLVQEYAKALKEISKELGVPAHLHVESVARMPEVLKIEEVSEVTGSEKKGFLGTLEKACKANDLERKREGFSLRKDLDSLLKRLEKELEQIQSVREEVNQSLLQKFEQKLKSRLTGVEIDSARISQEVVIQLEKSDINEELTRLKEHIKNYKHLVQSQEPQGKKLDFYTQELLREVNTIGSKSSVSLLTQSVVEAKTLIERLREQVQNVE
jgi:uncharacterized protein (TIGR00255 family)